MVSSATPDPLTSSNNPVTVTVTSSSPVTYATSPEQ